MEYAMLTDAMVWSAAAGAYPDEMTGAPTPAATTVETLTPGSEEAPGDWLDWLGRLLARCGDPFPGWWAEYLYW